MNKINIRIMPMDLIRMRKKQFKLIFIPNKANHILEKVIKIYSIKDSGKIILSKPTLSKVSIGFNSNLMLL